MKALGVRAYRFSIAWPRLFPRGTRRAQPQGPRLLSSGWSTSCWPTASSPIATLYHWDLPQALQDRGGWESRDTAQAFADYAGYVARQLSDRVGHFFTLNEMRTFVELGYGSGVFAPGLTLPQGRLNQVRHHAVLAHGLGVQAMRANGRARPESRPGREHHDRPAGHRDAAQHPRRRAGDARAQRALSHRHAGRPLHRRRTSRPPAPTRRASQRPISRRSRRPVDFVGINVYGPGAYVRARDKAPGYAELPLPASYPHMKSSWLDFAPRDALLGAAPARKLWNVKEIYITENGTSSTDKPAADGTVYDIDRIMFLRNYLAQLQRATAEGVPVRGYFLWSLLDNFEWADGYDDPLRAALCRLQDAEAHAQAQRLVLPQGHRAQRARLRATSALARSFDFLDSHREDSGCIA